MGRSPPDKPVPSTSQVDRKALLNQPGSLSLGPLFLPGSREKNTFLFATMPPTPNETQETVLSAPWSHAAKIPSLGPSFQIPLATSRGCGMWTLPKLHSGKKSPWRHSRLQ